MSKIKVATFSVAGDQHINEDAIIIRPHPQQHDLWLTALADGQGGRSGAAAAAQLAVQKMWEITSQTPPLKMKQPSYWTTLGITIDTTVRLDAEAGFTTLINIAVIDNQIYGNSVGDSGAILSMENKNLILTEDQKKNPPVGSGAADFRFFHHKLIGDWKLLLLSDGVWKYLGYKRVFDIVANYAEREMIEQIYQTTKQLHNGCLPDDFSLILLQNS